MNASPSASSGPRNSPLILCNGVLAHLILGAITVPSEQQRATSDPLEDRENGSTSDPLEDRESGSTSDPLEDRENGIGMWSRFKRRFNSCCGARHTNLVKRRYRCRNGSTRPCR